MRAFGDLLGMACFACITVVQLIPGVLSTFPIGPLNVRAPQQHFPIQPVALPPLPWFRTETQMNPVQVPLSPSPLNRLHFHPGTTTLVNSLPHIPTPLPGYQRHMLPWIAQPMSRLSMPIRNLQGGISNLFSLPPKPILHRPPLSPLSVMLPRGGAPPLVPASAQQIPLLTPAQRGLHHIMPPTMRQNPLLMFPPTITQGPLLPRFAPPTVIQGPISPLLNVLPGAHPIIPPVTMRNTPLSLPPRFVPQTVPPPSIQRSHLLHSPPAFGRGLPPIIPTPFLKRPPIIPFQHVLPNIPHFPPQIRPPLSPFSVMLPGGGTPPLVPASAQQMSLLTPAQRGLHHIMPSTMRQKPLLPPQPRVLPGRSLLPMFPPTITHGPLLPRFAPPTVIQGPFSPQVNVLPGAHPIVPPVTMHNTPLSLPPRFVPRRDVPQPVPPPSIQRSNLLHSPPTFGRGLPPIIPTPFLTRPPIIPFPQALPNIAHFPPQIRSPPFLKQGLPSPTFPLPGHLNMLQRRPSLSQPLVHGMTPSGIGLPLSLTKRFHPAMHAGHMNPIVNMFPLPNCDHSPPIQGTSVTSQPLVTPPPLSMSSAPEPVIRSLGGLTDHNANILPMTIRMLFKSDFGSNFMPPKNIDEQTLANMESDSKGTLGENDKETTENNVGVTVPSLNQDHSTQEDVQPLLMEHPSTDQDSETSPQLTNGLEFLLQKKSNSRF